MGPKETNVSIKYKARFVWSSKRNFFTNIPDDLNQFLCTNEGTMQSIVDNLHADQLYEIEVKIKSVKERKF